MTEIVGIAGGAAVVAVVVIVAVVAVRFERVRTRERLGLWRAFAAERGHRWITAEGPWYRRTSDAIEGTAEGTTFRLDTYVVSTGKTHVTYTRVRAELGRSFPGRLNVGRRSFFTGIAETMGRKTLRTGDAAFDQRFVARSSASDSALGVLDEGVRSRALSFPRPANLQVLDREAKLWWQGHETDAAVLDAAGGLIAAVARACARV